MKKLLFILIILLPAFIKAQQYVPFPDSNAVWSEYHQSSLSLGLHHYFFRNILTNKDTIINSKTYHQLFYSLVDTIYNTDTSITYNGGIREYNKQVFYLPKDSIHEYLLYDFSKNIGDTIQYDYSIYAHQFYDWMPINPIIISDIDSIMIENGTYRKRFQLQHIADYWIEGIGNTLGLLFPASAEPTDASVNTLGCFKQNETIIYFDNYYGVFNSCFPYTGITEETAINNNSLRIYPNPVTETSIIKWNKDFQFSTLEIYNVIGKSVLKTNVSNLSSFAIDGNLYKEGIYFIKLSDNNGNYFTSKVIIL
jgi:hypothetical protein